jgi:hypothetical protein
MKRIEFLGMLAGLPLALVGKGALGGRAAVPDDVADKITIMGDDGKEYQFRPESLMARKPSPRGGLTVVSFSRVRAGGLEQ